MLMHYDRLRTISLGKYVSSNEHQKFKCRSPHRTTSALKKNPQPRFISFDIETSILITF
jgi:hypothetical protein